jgi:hypothetical protein
VGCCEWATAGGPPSAHRGAVAIRRLDPEQVALEEILEPAAAVRPANDLAANGGFSS